MTVPEIYNRTTAQLLLAIVSNYCLKKKTFVKLRYYGIIFFLNRFFWYKSRKIVLDALSSFLLRLCANTNKTLFCFSQKIITKQKNCHHLTNNFKYKEDALFCVTFYTNELNSYHKLQTNIRKY